MACEIYDVDFGDAGIGSGGGAGLGVVPYRTEAVAALRIEEACCGTGTRWPCHNGRSWPREDGKHEETLCQCLEGTTGFAGEDRLKLWGYPGRPIVELTVGRASARNRPKSRPVRDVLLRRIDGEAETTGNLGYIIGLTARTGHCRLGAGLERPQPFGRPMYAYHGEGREHRGRSGLAAFR